MRGVDEVLAEAAAAYGPGLRTAVADLPEVVRGAVELHFGWRSADGTGAERGRGESTATVAGKGVRPALALLSCEALGGRAEAGLAAAVAVELVHNASLIHDDVVDGDEVRRDRPALWTELGVPAAVLAGDALFFLAIQVLDRAAGRGGAGRAPGGVAGGIVGVLTGALLDLVEGEYRDTLMDGGSTAGAAEAWAVASGKTGALIAASCELGALAAGAEPAQVGHMRAFGRQVGAAFQLVDDLLGIWGDPARTGKPTGSDLAARKKTLPVMAALASDTPAGAELRALYGRPGPLSPDEIARATCWVEDAGGRAWAMAEAELRVRQGIAALRAAGPAPVPAAELTALAGFLLHRDS